MSRRPYHDRFARYNLTDLEVARPFLARFVHDPRLQSVDLDQLALARDTQVNKHLDEVVTDLLFTAPYRDHQAYVTIVTEHKSAGALLSQDANLPFQMRKQELYVMDLGRRSHALKKPPAVLLIALLHGPKPYTGPRTVAETMDAPDHMIASRWKEPDAEIVDLCLIPDEELFALGGKLGVFLLVLKHIYDKDILDLIKALLPELQTIEAESQDYIVQVFTYLYGASRVKNRADLDKIAVQSFTKETGDAVMSIAEQLEKIGEERGLKIGEQRGLKIGEQRGLKIGEQRGLKIGEQRGLKIGEERGLKIGEQRGRKIGEERGLKIGEQRLRAEMFNVARRLLNKKMDLEDVAEISGLPIEEVRQLHAERDAGR